MARVVLDVGGGGDRRLGCSCANRAVGPRGTREKDVTLDLARRVRRALGEQGIEAQLTRDSDVNLSLRDRAALCAAEQAEALVGLRFNSDRDRTTQGSAAWVHPSSPPSSQ